jgi:hypothetical protein
LDARDDQRISGESRVRGQRGQGGWRAIGFDERFVWAEPFGWYDGEGDR